MKRFVIFLLTVVLTVALFAGCGGKAQSNVQDNTGTSAQQMQEQGVQTGQDGQPGQGAQQEEAKEAAEESKFPLTVKDAKGVEVTIEKRPESIISLTLATDEILFDLVDKSRIKAITYLSEDPGLSNITEAAKDFPLKIGTDTEKIISLQPDLVFMTEWSDDKVLAQLRDAGITVYTYKTPTSIDEMKSTVMEIARLVGEEDKGEEIVRWMDEKLKAVADKVGSLKDEDKLTVLSIDSFFYTFGTGTTFDDMCARAGLVNLASKSGLVSFGQINKEKVVELNPDVIFLPSWSYEGFDANKFAEDFRKDKSLAGVKAVKNGKVFMLPDAHTTSISHYMVLAVEDMAKAAYPDLFK